MNIVNMLKNLIRWSVINSFSNDDKNFPVHQISYMGKLADAVAWYPYGFHANPPGNTLAILLSLTSNPEDKVMMPGSPKERIDDKLPTPLKAGEVLIYNPITKSYIHILSNGSININSQKDMNLTMLGNLNANVTGTADISVQGNIDVDANGTINIDSGGKTTIVGNGSVEINGATFLELKGDIVRASDGGATEKLCNETFMALFNAHVHTGAGTNPPTVLGIVGTHTTDVLRGE